MALYFFDMDIISRGKGRSITKYANYITDRSLHDGYLDRKFYDHRDDILFRDVFLPEGAPNYLGDIQTLCHEIDRVEKRKDSRTAKIVIGALPRELDYEDQLKIVEEFVTNQLTSLGYCVIAAIHEGKKDDPAKENPHMHLIISDRQVGPDGFYDLKDRDWIKSEHLDILREAWADVINRAYKRNHLNIRVSHLTLKVQGITDREPVKYLHRVDWRREQRGEVTVAGEKRRKIEQRNKERKLKSQQNNPVPTRTRTR